MDEPPRLRWRLLGWLFAAFVLLPVLYVAMRGPLAWWYVNSYREPQWLAPYSRTLRPLYQHPQVGPVLDQYCAWWRSLPVPRSWRRQTLADDLASRRALFERERANIQRVESEATALQVRLDALDSLTEPTPEQTLEASTIHSRLKELKAYLSYMPIFRLPPLERNIKQAEDALRAFDATKH